MNPGTGAQTVVTAGGLLSNSFGLALVPPAHNGVVPAPPGGQQAVAGPKDSTDDSDKPRQRTETQRQQRERTNQSNLDQYHVEGNVAAVEPIADGSVLLVTIALVRDETLVVEVRCPRNRCPAIRVGDYLSAEGEQGGREEQGHFLADEIEVIRNGRRVH